MKIFFDLDGTLIDSRFRMHALFQRLVPHSNFSFDSYWKLKRDNLKHEDILKKILGYTNEAYCQFQEEWLSEIERPEWLSMDKPFDGVRDYLIELKEYCDLYIVTKRRCEKETLDQLRSIGLLNTIDKVIFADQQTEKHRAVNSQVMVTRIDWFVGDTGLDIECGRALGIRTAAVLTGFMSREFLERYNPELIIEKVTDLKFRQLMYE